MNKSFTWIVLFLTIISTAHAATYYVSTSGSDTNNGLSTGAPWKTINKINSMSFQPGDSILFKRGEIWNEGITFRLTSSGTEAAPINYSAYGSGEKPIISGALDSSKEGWNWAASSRPNYYYLTRSGSNPNIPNGSVYGVRWRLFYLDRTEICGGSINSLNNGQWAYGNLDGLSYNTIYLRKDNGVPNHVFVPVTEYLIISLKSFTVFEDLIWEMSAGGGLWWITETVQTGLTLNNIISRYHGSSAAGVSGTNVQNHNLNLNILNSRFHNSGEGLGVTGGYRPCPNLPYQHTGVLVDNSEFDHNNGTGPVNGDGMKWFWIDRSELRNSVSHDNAGKGFNLDGMACDTDGSPGHDIGAGDSYNEIHHNVAYNNSGTGILFEYYGVGNDIHHNLVYDNALDLTTWSGGIWVTEACQNNTVRYNIVRNNGEAWRANLASAYQKDQNNIFVHNTVDGNSRNAVSISSKDSIIKNNIFMRGASVPMLEYRDSGIGVTDIDYNIWHGINSFRLWINNVESWWTLAQFQANTPWCDHCSYETSLNIRNGDDYTPPDEARFVGVAGLPAWIYADGDFLGRPVNLANPTKGAFEYSGGTQSTTYYVSSSAGNDAWPGTQAQPWQTLNKVNSFLFNPGDSILFKRGDTWRETLDVQRSGTAGNPITFSAYGTGINPIISGGEIITGWNSEVVGSFTAYWASLTIQPYRVIENKNWMNSIASKSSLVPGSYWYDTGNLRLYIRTSGDNNPNNYVIEAARRYWAIEFSTTSNLVFDNLISELSQGDYQAGFLGYDVTNI